MTPTPVAVADGGSESQPETIVDVIDSEELEAAAAALTGRAHDAENDFILDQAAQGILLDSADVSAAAVGAGTYAWSANVQPEEVAVARHLDDDGEQADAEIGIITEPSSELEADAYPVMGSNALTSLSGVASSWGGCVSAVSAGDRLTSCWSLYRAKEPTFKPDRNYFYYGRYVVATGESRDGSVDEYPMRMDIRSRPTEGTGDRVLSARSYYPFPSTSECSSSSVGVEIAGFGATLPISNCKNTVVTPDGKAIKVEFSAGSCHDSRSEGLDLGITFAADADKPRPAYSDYSYARFSSNPTGPCDLEASNDVRVIFTDPGW